MKLRSQRQRRVSGRAVKTNRSRTRHNSDEEDYVPPSDSDSSGSDKGGVSFLKEDELKHDEEGGGTKELDGNDKGKVMIEISEGDSVTDDAADSDYIEHLKESKKTVSEKKGKRPVHRGKKPKSNMEQDGEESNNVEPEVTIYDLEEVSGYWMDEQKKKNNTQKKKKRKRRPTLLWEALEEENERWLDANETEDVNFDRLDDEVAETAEEPQDLLMPLLRYQREWLAWAMKQEDSELRGGILADEMGMGKTIQAIALVLAKHASHRSSTGSTGPLSSPGPSTALPKVKCTLVICPVVAVMQWADEIDRFTPKGSTKVLVYHGVNKKKIMNEFSEFDFVLTTYSTVEADYRKNVMPPKEKCIWCGKLFCPKKMVVHLQYFCGPNAVKTAKQSKQVRKEGKHKLNYSEVKMKPPVQEDEVIEFEGSKVNGAGKKTKKQQKQEKRTMPGDISSNGRPTNLDQGTPAGKSALHSVKWERIILDEAHYIKDRRSNTAKGVLALESSYKWALSGTPLQNRVGELYSLVRFLQIVPYSYYFCRDCDCKSLDYSSTTQCPNCVHKSVRHFCWWNRFIAKPIQCPKNVGDGRRAMVLLKNKLLKTIVLRRTKKGRSADLALPPRIVSLRRDRLDIKEEEYYKSLYNESQLQFNTYVEAGTLMNNYAHIFDLLTRLRQAVDHPYLVVYSKTAALRNGSATDASIGEQDCGICHDAAEEPVVTACAHVFCKACLVDYSTTLEQGSCPSCSKPLTVDFTAKMNAEYQGTKTTIKGYRHSSILSRICLEDFQTSTKIDALREEIRFMIERDGSAKGIVFSQFTSFLDLISYALHKSGLNCVQLVGSMSMTARNSSIKRFTDDPDCKIFLMSLKAGGVALNLTVASHVFLMDPWWNPAVERQAQDRIHRIGQYKPIRIIRFIIEDTIEERILKLQEKKELVFEGTIGGSSEALGKLTAEDLRFLFTT
ncbi:PREDICTED: DNA repair protein RAD16 [Nelumbo nucifera]|uniref:DNA repair protein RAD16 n=2 Tax=Nelumbo nucifera TaxID=4432 RepID=A0A1U7ZB71_NELNU|nr:PREDICTED: DNA repair protein RAD16 [Nelumbo nucifera]DAD20441.1 TPA_asm: hypothetical protein HUJ06_021904 [Nelumbo nucifera]